jgi:putative Mg2+ transporter-C (MgtC) family protein
MGWVSLDTLAAYWSANEIVTNIIVFMNLLGALFLGLLVGYERSYHGRAAGMRTYGLVCMASCAVVVIIGYPGYWYGGHAAGTGSAAITADPTRVIQGIVTGVGFIGAGVIMREGLNISGLTTAASIWAASVIGILVGIGFYAAAILLSVLSAACMLWVSRLEAWLPSRHAIAVVLRYQRTVMPREEELAEAMLERGYQVAKGSFSVHFEAEQMEWRFVAIALGNGLGMPLSRLARELSVLPGVNSFNLSHARN